MTTDYRPPSWATPPISTEWQLSEIKSGVVVAKHALTQACLLIGRAEDQVDLIVAHPSTSRWHARLAFDSSGRLWLKDLESVHGTFVNKKQLPKEACSKLESNSTQKGVRGVVVYPGDVLQFGASSRRYALDGPEEQSRTSVRIRHQTQQTQSEHPQQPTSLTIESEKSKDVLVAWGIDMDEPSDSRDGISIDLPIEVWDDKVPTQYRKEWEQLKAMKYKLEHIQSESSRISRKGDLTEGQRKQLDRNEARVMQLEDEIRPKEESLFYKLHPSLNDRQRSSTVESTFEDEVDDRTKSSDQMFDPKGETELSLTQKWTNLLLNFNLLKTDLQKELAVARRWKQRLDRLEENDDEEAFFARNELSLSQDSVTKVKSRHNEVAASLKETEALLRVINRKLTFDRASGFVGIGPAPKADQSTDVPPPTSAITLSGPASKEEDCVMSAPQSSVALDVNAIQSSPSSMLPSEFSMPAPKRPRTVGPLLPGEQDKSHSLTGHASSQPMPQGTLAALSSFKIPGKQVVHSSGVNSRNNRVPAHSESQLNAEPFDPKNDTWKAPMGQDGSGRTRLNDKFAGRY